MTPNEAVAKKVKALPSDEVVDSWSVKKLMAVLAKLRIRFHVTSQTTSTICIMFVVFTDLFRFVGAHTQRPIEKAALAQLVKTEFGARRARLKPYVTNATKRLRKRVLLCCCYRCR